MKTWKMFYFPLLDMWEQDIFLATMNFQRIFQTQD